MGIYVPEVRLAKSAFVRPTPGDVHVDRNLTNISIAFIQDQSAFVAMRVFPNIPVNNQSDVYYLYDKGEMNRNEVKVRAPATEAPVANWKTSTDSYYAPRRALANDIPDEVRSNADSVFSLDRDGTTFVTQQGMIQQEITWSNSYFTSGNPGTTWTFHVDGAATATAPGAFDPTDAANNDKAFWNLAASTPIEDVRQGKRFVQRRTGFRPNIMTLGRTVFDTLIDHPDIVGRLDRGQTDGPAQATLESLAALFELEEVLVMDAVQNTAAEGQTESNSFIGGDHALLSYRPQNPGILVPSAGYTFSWTGFLGATTTGMRIRRKRMDLRDADRIEMDMAYDQKRVAQELGYLFQNIVQ